MLVEEEDHVNFDAFVNLLQARQGCSIERSSVEYVLDVKARLREIYDSD